MFGAYGYLDRPIVTVVQDLVTDLLIFARSIGPVSAETSEVKKNSRRSQAGNHQLIDRIRTLFSNPDAVEATKAWGSSTLEYARDNFEDAVANYRTWGDEKLAATAEELELFCALIDDTTNYRLSRKLIEPLPAFFGNEKPPSRRMRAIDERTSSSNWL